MDIKKVIAKYPRIHLTPLPTPLEFAPQLTKMLGGPKIYVKRDDLTAIAFGGNKTRKLEFLMADAVKQNADTVITLCAARNKVMLGVETAKIKEFQHDMLKYFATEHPEIGKEI